MNISAPFIRRPIGTSLLAAALVMAGALAFNYLPVAPLPQVEFPVISVGAGLAGSQPRDHGVSGCDSPGTPVRTHRRHQPDDLDEPAWLDQHRSAIRSQSQHRRRRRDVQAAINAARSQLPANLPGNPSYRKVNPADAPILILALTSDTYTLPQMYDAADSILAQKLSQVSGVGQVFVGGAARPAVRAELNPTCSTNSGLVSIPCALPSVQPMQIVPKVKLSGPLNLLHHR